MLTVYEKKAINTSWIYVRYELNLIYNYVILLHYKSNKINFWHHVKIKVLPEKISIDPVHEYAKKILSIFDKIEKIL